MKAVSTPQPVRFTEAAVSPSKLTRVMPRPAEIDRAMDRFVARHNAIEAREKAMRDAIVPPKIYDSLGDFSEFDPDVELGTPRTMEACAVNGVHPQELAYLPMDVFEADEDVLEPVVLEMRHEFYEARRQDLLASVRLSWNDICSGRDSCDRASKPPPGPWPDKLVTLAEHPGWASPRLNTALGLMPRTLQFFKKYHEEFSLFGEARKIERSAGATPSPGVYGVASPKHATSPLAASGDGNMWGTTTLLALSGVPASLQRSASDSRFNITASTEALHEMLGYMREVPDTTGHAKDPGTRVEYDAARKTENDLVTVKEILDRRRAEQQWDLQRLAKKRQAMANKQFQAQLADYHQAKRDRDKREEISQLSRYDKDPTQLGKKGDPSKLWVKRTKSTPFLTEAHQEARDYNERFVHNYRVYQNKRMQERLRDNSAVELRLAEEKHLKQLKSAQQTMEDRVRWRHQHSVVMADKKAKDEATVVAFKAKDQRVFDLSAAKRRLAALRKELEILRETYRKMSLRQQEWKEEYFRNRRKADGKKRIAEEKESHRSKIMMMCSSKSAPALTVG